MTTLYLAGAEQAANRNLLIDCGVTRYGFNITNLARAVKRLDQWDVREHLPENAEWALYADQGSSWSMAEPVIAQQPTLVIGPASWAKDMGEVPFAPYWTEGLEPGLDMVALLDEAVKRQSTLRQVLSQYSQSMLVAVTGSSRGVERLDMVVSSAWLEVQRHGETQVWGGTKLHRYPNSQKATARSRHVADMERLGIDPDLVAADDPKEVARLAVVSWQEWEERHSRMGSLVALPTPLSSNASPDHPAVTSSRAKSPTKAALTPRHDRVIPVLTLEPIVSRYTDASGREVVEETAAMAMRPDSSRACDTCYLARNCPAFNPGHACAYSIPIEIRTKDQLNAAMRGMVEMQAQRVLFARFAEELDGQGIDPAVSGELERFFRVLKDMRDVTDTRDVLRFEMEAKAGAGVLSRLFGSDVGAAARSVSVSMEADDVIDALDPDDP